LYTLAREGIEVERAARPVTVYALELLEQQQPAQTQVKPRPLSHLSLRIECSGGFYVRTLVDDLAKHLHTCAHMTQLLRTHQGGLGLDDCVHLLQPATKTITLDYEQICRNLRHCSDKLGIN
jgi:tRNA pseudouridine55 synthase